MAGPLNEPVPAAVEVADPVDEPVPVAVEVADPVDELEPVAVAVPGALAEAEWDADAVADALTACASGHSPAAGATAVGGSHGAGYGPQWNVHERGVAPHPRGRRNWALNRAE